MRYAASGDPIVVIRVRNRTGDPVEGASVIIRGESGDGIVSEIARGDSDQRGLVHLCGAPRRMALFVTAMRDGYRTGTARSQTGHDLTAIDVRLEPRRPTAGVPEP